MASSSATVPATDGPFTSVPGPWTCKGECFWLFGYTRTSEPRPGPPAFSPLEGASQFADPARSGEYKGGLTSVMIARYTDSPVGPYDEILWIPGKFVVPQSDDGEEVRRVTRVYSSTKDSVYNARKNWNLPAALATFTFEQRPTTSPSDIPYSRISIASEDTPDAPFFIVDLEPTLVLSGGTLPFIDGLLPLADELVIPPLPQSADVEDDARVGTDAWVSFTPTVRGKAGFFRSKGGLAGGHAYGDSVGFPDVQPWRTGMWFRDFEIGLPVAERSA